MGVNENQLEVLRLFHFQPFDQTVRLNGFTEI